MAKKSTYAEVERRVMEVYQMILSGQQRPSIVSYCTAKWDVSTRTADDYLARARENMRAAIGIENMYLIGRMIKRANRHAIKDLNPTPLNYQ